MRLIATLLLTILCFGLSAAEFSGADLTAIAEKAKTLKVGESTSVKVMIDGKAVYVGLVMGASGLTVAGEGVPSGTYKFLFTDQGMVVQSTKAGQTATVLVSGNRVAPAPADLSRAFGSGAVSTFAEVAGERLEAARNADQQRQSQSRIFIGQPNVSSAILDLNSLSASLDVSFALATWSTTSDVLVPDSWTTVVTQNDSNLTTVVNNASGATNP